MKVFMAMAFAVSALAQDPNATPSTTTPSTTTTTPGSMTPSNTSLSTSSEDTTTVTAYFPSCSTLPVGNYSITATSTGTVTSTLPCDECEKTKGIYTTYTTVYDDVCPTGLAPMTYTIVELCTETGQPRPSTYIPQGFVVTPVACAPCEQPTVTITTPTGTPTPVPAPVITPVPVNTSTVCHTCNMTITSIQFGQATASIGFSVVTLFSIIAGAFILL